MEIIPDIYQVDGVSGNSFIIDRDNLTIIDTGIPGSGKKILAHIRDTLHRDPADVRSVIITHFHLDHIGGVTALKNASPALEIAIGNADAGYVDGSLPLPVNPGLRGLLLRVAGFIMKPDLFRPDILLGDGNVISGLRCIALPGHTPGSIGLLDQSAGALFCSDLLRYDGTRLAEGPSYATMDLAASRASIRKIATLDFDVLLPGHGVPLVAGAAGKVREFAAGLHS
jgi:glyoxylase-like metal-dependent hydrolase (beta-lactamase superfamily II)